MEKVNPVHSLLGQLNKELVERYGFDCEYIKYHPVTFATLTSAVDAGHEISTPHVAYYLTGDRSHLPVDQLFNGFESREDPVYDDFVGSVGSPAVSETAMVVEDNTTVMEEAQSYVLN